PEEITKLYAEARRGFDVVFGRRYERKDAFLKRAASRVFYWLFDYMTDQKSDATIANFGIYSRRVIESF
ncbi:MAG: glycosyltransferase, partial [Dissulfurimicrobium sp.]